MLKTILFQAVLVVAALTVAKILKWRRNRRSRALVQLIHRVLQDPPEGAAGTDVAAIAEVPASEMPVRRLRFSVALRSGSRGSCMLEMAFFVPAVFFLSVGALDWGFYAYSLISVQSAARTAALYTSTNGTTATDSSGACSLALAELRMLPNIGSTTTTCNGGSLTVSTAAVNGPDSAQAARVSITYTTVPLIAIPGLLKNQWTVTRMATMRLRA